MPYLHTYKLFISHAWSYSESYIRAVNFLNSAANFAWQNFSVPTIKAFEPASTRDLQERLRQQIRPTQCVIIIAGMYAAHSAWIQFEIDFAKQLGKPILGIRPWGAERIPFAVSSAATTMVGWNAASIVSAIREITP